jgi:hypothetical protein
MNLRSWKNLSAAPIDEEARKSQISFVRFRAELSNRGQGAALTIPVLAQ